MDNTANFLIITKDLLNKTIVIFLVYDCVIMSVSAVNIHSQELQKILRYNIQKQNIVLVMSLCLL